ncbi:TerB family tellurite resistance protein [Thalassospira sp. MCCC 1A01428]|uniref:tellurite resistance TerB family protein n=1 Tax=Thalassospira sp. MCCC 1A01428 TaxID=1470575 RepID=UPI000A1F648A|nr:TerB family tellurite resistance protein [Thalassospira sp. MCCC 1A01428]OSQ34369.1 hypothetical protein THS27_25535 [Thalassospira sp. MCCC 1A01428]
MAFLEFFKPKLAPEITVSISTNIPFDATESARPETADEYGDIDLSDISIAIEYRDSKNRVTTRRIVIYSTWTEQTAYRLHAYCYERHAYRQFLSTGIVSIIDIDGVVSHPVDFFRDELQIIVNPAFFPARDAAPLPEIESNPGQRIKKYCRPDLRLLSTLSRSDGYMHPAEIQFMLAYAQKVADFHNEPFTEIDAKALAAYIKRLRPTEDQVNDAIDGIWKHHKHRRKMFVEACHGLIQADGIVKPEELEALSELVDEFS